MRDIQHMKVSRIRQKFSADRIDDIQKTLAQELLNFKSNIQEYKHIAIAVGSRGIANIALIVQGVVDQGFTEMSQTRVHYGTSRLAGKRKTGGGLSCADAPNDL